ncbi:mannose-specific lectin-like [Clupea harengus]|uniref:Mannose-specific lectin-like n=1 Tax=Clupea harengus TaxID=7950 RepID=A0A6P8FRC4_CLUHA|nr:mannose-specific lectin-like [Clupea harengus]
MSLNRLTAPGQLYPGDFLRSNNNAATATFTADGNFVVTTTKQVWETSSAGNGGAFIIMQADGNLVIYDGNDTPIWASQTGGNGGPASQLCLADDGHLQILDGGKLIWSRH